MSTNDWRTHNESGSKRVVVTKELPGDRWLEILAAADCRVEIGTSTEILSVEEIKDKIGDACDSVIGQLTETWAKACFPRSRMQAAKRIQTTPWGTTMSMWVRRQNTAFPWAIRRGF